MRPALVVGAALVCMAGSSVFAQADDAVPWDASHVTKTAVKPSDPTSDALPFVADTLFDMGKGRGYAGQITDDKARLTTVYWKGRAPSELTAYATSLPLGVKVRVVDNARFSQDEAKSAATRVVSSPIAAEIGIVKVSVNSDGSGMRVFVSGNDPGTRTLKRLEDIAVMPGAVKVLPNQPKIVPQASRTNDAPPWKGGSRTIHGGSGACTTGFAVLSGSIGYLLSANHCDPSANLSVRDGANQTIAPGGSSVDEIPDLDSLLIDPSASPATQGSAV